MKKISTLIILVVLMSFVTNMTAFACSTTPKIKVTVNKQVVKYDVSPYLSKGEVMVPVEETAEAIGGKVEWDKKAQTMWLHLGMAHAEFIVGKSKIYIHRDADFTGTPQTVKLSTPIKYSRGSVFVPAKTTFENLGLTVSWDSKKRVLTMTGEKSSLPAKVIYDELSYDNIKDNLKLVQWYSENNQKQGVSYIKDRAYTYVLLGAGERPTGGYSINIDNIYYSASDTVTIRAFVAPPGDNVRVIMMITYPSMILRIKSDTLNTVVGEVLDTKINGVTMDITNVTKMELYDLNQVKLRDVTGSEKDEIMNSFNNATIDYNPYIKMIAGKILKVTTADGYLLTFSSYGSDTKVIVSLEKNGVSKAYHLLAPGIAKYIYQ